MKFSTAAQNGMLPLALGHLWIPERFLARSHEIDGKLRPSGRNVAGSKFQASGGSGTADVDFPNESLASNGGDLEKEADLGILSSLEKSEVRRLDATCDDYVECENGLVVGDASQTCEEACDGQCCDGDDACSGFTGKVCKDGKSCMGTGACEGATIGFVINSCKSVWACDFAKIEFAYGSCTSTESCSIATLEKVYSSCNEPLSCRSADHNGFMADSCNDFKSCYRLGSTIGNITNSCNGDNACSYAAARGTLGNIVDSCNGSYACAYFAQHGAVGDVRYSCNAQNSCYNVARYDGEIYDGLERCCNVDSECSRSTGLESNENFRACFSTPVPSSSPMPSASPSSSLKPSVLPSWAPSASPSSSLMPSTLPSSSTSPSTYPTEVDRQVLTTVNDIVSEVQEISADTSSSSGIDSVTCEIPEPVSCQMILGAEADVKVVRHSQEQTDIIVLVSSGGTAIDADGNPELVAFDPVNRSEVSIVPQGITKFSTGMYSMRFISPHKVFWIKYLVDGTENTVMFKTTV